MFERTEINVESYLKNINHSLSASPPVNFRYNKENARRIHKFVDYYINKRHVEIHPSKLEGLKRIKDILLGLLGACDKANEADVKKKFSELVDEFKEYSSFGSVYLLRHPEKTKELGRNLTFMGVKQAKQVAERIREEILICPKTVRVLLYTSELRRTYLFAYIIKHINKAEKIGKTDIQIVQEEDSRLFMRHLSDEFYALYNRYKGTYGSNWDFKAFKDWINKTEDFLNVINKGGIQNPDNVRENINEFVRFAQKESLNPNIYTIVVGISHSWMLDTWLYHLTGIEEIISTAEYAKIEKTGFYYKGKWKELV